jgi:hypothetical protein
MVTWALAALALAASGDWQQVGRGGDVDVFTRTQDGERVSEFRAIKVIPATPAELRAVLEDEAYSRKNPHLSELRTVASPSSNERVLYGRVHFPFFKDRDYFIDTVIEKDLSPDGGGSFRESWHPWGMDRPTRANVIRVTRNDGYWEIQPLSGGRSRVEYYVAYDPGGNIPGWAIDAINRHVLPDLLRDLEREALRRRPAH